MIRLKLLMNFKSVPAYSLSKSLKKCNHTIMQPSPKWCLTTPLPQGQSTTSPDWDSASQVLATALASLNVLKSTTVLNKLLLHCITSLSTQLWQSNSPFPNRLILRFPTLIPIPLATFLKKNTPFARCLPTRFLVAIPASWTKSI